MDRDAASSVQSAEGTCTPQMPDTKLYLSIATQNCPHEEHVDRGISDERPPLLRSHGGELGLYTPR